ncbi:MAG TPA: Gfo/Idh/MocA family oxidoreductase [Gaiellaceae bacterium]|nr:Gfo/Idh/MocA family oxidoreductase [Gaiellaceae bacterium]
MPEPLRLGLLSTARINRRILPAAAASDLVEVAAVGSRTPERAEAYAREHGIPVARGSYEALLADSSIDAVYVPLPNSLHVEWSRRALEAGKHVLCEKPLTERSAEAETLFHLAGGHGLVLAEAFMYRHNPQTRRLAELVRDGAIGRLGLVRTSFSFAVEGAANIRLDSELGGGSLGDLGCYCVSGARLLAGEPASAFGRAVVGPTGVDDLFTGSLSFPGGVHALFDCGLRLPFRATLEAVGTDGALFVDDPWLCRRPGIELRRGESVERIGVEAADSYRLELDDFARAVAGESEPLLGRADAVAQARVLGALRRSAQDGAAVSL